MVLRLAIVFLMLITFSISTVSGQNNNQAANANQNAKPDPAQDPKANDDDAKSKDEPKVGRNGLPLFSYLSKNIPSMEDLLQKPSVDWILMKPVIFDDPEVLVVKPVYPRPDTIAQLAKAKEKGPDVDLGPKPKPKKGVGAAAFAKILFEWRKPELIARLKLNYLDVEVPDKVKLPDGADSPEFQLEWAKQIEKIIYHQDLIIMRSRLMMQAGQLPEVYELLTMLERRHPTWPGLAKVRNELNFREAKAALVRKQPYLALHLLEDLQERDREFEGLQSQLGEVIDDFVSAAMKDSDYRRARHFIGRLVSREPKHEIGTKWIKALTAETEKLLVKSEQATAKKEHIKASELAIEASSIWPRGVRLRDVHRKATSRFQRLTVGVLRFAGEPSAYVLPTIADRRIQDMLQTRMFDIDAIDEAAHYGTEFFEEWEPTELGRRMVFRLRQSRSASDARPFATAASIVRTLKKRLDINNPAYDERLDDYIASITVRSPFEFHINFDRVPVRTEALFRIPLESETVIKGKTPADPDKISDDDPAYRFRLHSQDKTTRVYRRMVSEPDGLNGYHIGEIRELKYTSYSRLIQSLMRGEISMIPHLPASQARRLAKDSRFYLGTYAIPLTHVLQFNPKSKALRNAQLRRALLFGLDREKLLNEVILKDSAGRGGRVVTAPYPTSSYAYNQARVKTRSINLNLAYSLALVGKANLGKNWKPPMTMVCEPEPDIQEAAKKIVAQWKRIGIDVTLVTDPKIKIDINSDNWDIVYRTVRMAEPITELWPMLTLKNRSRVDDLSFLPDWLKKDLIEVDQTVDMKTATDRLLDLHYKLESTVQLIPLWEVDDIIVIRSTISKFPLHPISPYHNVEAWVAAPWFPTDLQ